jgi:transposase-like protein
MKELSPGKNLLHGVGEEERSGVERSGTERSDDSPTSTRSTFGHPRPAGSSQADASGSVSRPTPPDPEVRERPKSRRFTAAYKLSIITAADRCTKPGQIGALLRREGLYTSHLSHWRKQRDAGALGALSGQKRGPKPEAPNPLAPRVAQQQREINRLEKKLQKAEAIIEFQKKIAALLEIPLQPYPDEEND